ncbi:MAG: tetratricopeptide repeat protein [Phycisphaerales bacterium]|jgi:Tfp pilus assembly protein PilF|nr:tetratricopeptide repeat protein [Phycisphaerales bacterium]
MNEDRLHQLQAMLLKSPKDAFLLYGLAMEFKKKGQSQTALDYLQQVIEVDPLYCYAYFQRGQIFENLGEPEDARKAYQLGIDAAGRKGDAHAQQELQGALSMLE